MSSSQAITASDDPVEGDVETAEEPPSAESLRDRILRPLDTSVRVGWIGTAVVTALAAVLRLVGLDRVQRLAFDETYYVKQAYSMLALGYEGNWDDEVDDAFASGDYSGLNDDPDYVVHPPLGKWLIAIGMRLLGTDSFVGWRLSAAIAGIIGVFLVTRIGRRLFNSNLIGIMAGGLLAVDGMHIVLSRTSILDIFVSTLVLAGLYTLLRDREWYRQRLADRVAGELAEHGKLRDPWGPRIGVRWWLVATGVLLGLSCGVKWSGIYAVAVFGVIAVIWSVTARHAVGVRLWVGAGLVRDGISSFLALVPTAVLAYVAGWASWFASDNAYNRTWATNVNAVAEVPQRTWLPDTINSFWEYHLQMWNFHRGLDSEHTYSSHPIGWMLQLRPTSIVWGDVDAPAGETGRWVEAVLAVGNPVVWWGGTIALVVLVWFAIRHRDWRAWAVMAGFLAMYVPWFSYSAPFANRTIFTFYTVAFAPYVALALAFALAVLLGPARPSRIRRRQRALIVSLILAGALVAAAFFWPIWSGEPIPYDYWRAHMWVPNIESIRIGWI